MIAGLPAAALAAWVLMVAGVGAAVLAARALALGPSHKLRVRVLEAAGATLPASPERAAGRRRRGQRARGRDGAGVPSATARLLEQAGTALTPDELRLARLGVALAAALLGYLVAGAVPALLVGAAAFMAPLFWLRSVAEARMRALEGQIADAMVLVSAALHAGYALPQALLAAARESPAPLGPYLTEGHRRAALGVPLEDSLAAFAQRLGQDDLALVATAIAVQRQVGGNLAEILDGIAETVRDRIQLRQRLRAATAQNRLSATILTLLPVGLALILLATAGSFVSVLWTTRAGLAILVVIVLLDVVGVTFIRRVGRIDV